MRPTLRPVQTNKIALAVRASRAAAFPALVSLGRILLTCSASHEMHPVRAPTPTILKPSLQSQRRPTLVPLARTTPSEESRKFRLCRLVKSATFLGQPDTTSSRTLFRSTTQTKQAPLTLRLTSQALSSKTRQTFANQALFPKQPSSKSLSTPWSFSSRKTAKEQVLLTVSNQAFGPGTNCQKSVYRLNSRCIINELSAISSLISTRSTRQRCLTSTT